MESVPKTFQYFVEAETAGLQVLELKEQILELHKRLNETREALAIVTKSDFKKGYMHQGELLMKRSREDVISKLKQNFKDLNEEIRKKGEDMKEKVYKLQDIEKQDFYRGKSLIPLERNELNALSQVWGGHTQ